MRKTILLLSMLTLSGLSKGQVGINTPNPQGSLHVDGAKDNAATGIPTLAQQSNDFSVLSNGNVGIGTTTPASKLDLGTSSGKKLAIWNSTAGDDFYGFGAAQNALQFFSGVPATGNALMTLTKNGRVGIGTGAPQHTLHSIGTLRFEGVNTGQTTGMVLTATDNLGTATWQALPAAIVDTSIYAGNGTISGANTTRTVDQATNNLAFTSTATAGTSHFTVDGTTLNVDAVNNRLGVGTATPNSTLQVVGNEMRVGGPASQTGTIADPVLRIHSNANADGSGGSLIFSENAQNFGYYIRHNTSAGTTYGRDGLAIGSAQTGQYTYNPARPGIFVSENQSISFGTATPQAVFHVDGARDNNINTLPTADQQYNDLVINTSGNLGLGTLSPSSRLHVVSKDLDVAVIEQANSSVSSGGPYLTLRKNQSDNPTVNSAVTAGSSIGAITFDGNTGNGYTGTGIGGKPSMAAYAVENFSSTAKGAMLTFSTVPTGTITAQRRMTINPDGKIGIGRSATTNLLEVNGDASKNTAGSWLGNSDARLKKEVKQISSEEALEKLLKLKGVYYYWNDDKTGITRPKEKQIGFIAQNIQEVFPEKVSTDKNGYLQTAYGDYDAILVEAIRALTEKNERLENKINELEARISRIQ